MQYLQTADTAVNQKLWTIDIERTTRYTVFNYFASKKKRHMLFTKIVGPWAQGGVINSSKWIGFCQSNARRLLR